MKRFFGEANHGRSKVARKDNKTSELGDTKEKLLECPICSKLVASSFINSHVDSHVFKTEPNPKKIFNSSLISIDQVPGLYTFPDFITDEEELETVEHLHATSNPWSNGTLTGVCFNKSFGVKTDFVLRVVRPPIASELNLTDKLRKLADGIVSKVTFSKLKGVSLKSEWSPNECNAHWYRKQDGHFLKPHYDDRKLSGKSFFLMSDIEFFLINIINVGSILCTLSMLSDCEMTFKNSEKEVKVSLPRKSLSIGRSYAFLNHLLITNS